MGSDNGVYVSGDINIDCADSEVIHRQQDVISRLLERVRSLNRMVAQLRTELDELHARHRPKEGQ